MKKIALLIIICIGATNVIAQNNEPTNIYEGCCGKKRVEFTTNKANIFVPNVFTPNGDGVNDYFMPYISDEVSEVRSFKIFSAKGDTLIFRRLSFNFDDFKNNAWNGTRTNGDGFFVSNYAGAFKYEMRIITKEKKLSIIKGEACALQCGKETKIFKTKEGCYYPSQAAETDNKGKNKGTGKVDKSLVSQEKDCF